MCFGRLTVFGWGRFPFSFLFHDNWLGRGDPLRFAFSRNFGSLWCVEFVSLVLAPIYASHDTLIDQAVVDSWVFDRELATYGQTYCILLFVGRIDKLLDLSGNFIGHKRHSATDHRPREERAELYFLQFDFGCVLQDTVGVVCDIVGHIVLEDRCKVSPLIVKMSIGADAIAFSGGVKFL